jgi:hypothetical protein
MPPTYKNASPGSLVSTTITVKYPMPRRRGLLRSPRGGTYPPQLAWDTSCPRWVLFLVASQEQRPFQGSDLLPGWIQTELVGLAPQHRLLWLGRAFPLRLCGLSVFGHDWGSSFWLLLICSLIAVRISPWMERLCCLATLRKASSISTVMRIEKDFVGSSCVFIRLVYIQIGCISRGTPLKEERAFYPRG